MLRRRNVQVFTGLEDRGVIAPTLTMSAVLVKNYRVWSKMTPTAIPRTWIRHPGLERTKDRSRLLVRVIEI